VAQTAPQEQHDHRPTGRPRRPLVVPVLSACIGFAILVTAILLDQAVSVGSALGALLLLSAAIRFEIARRTT